MRLLLSIKNNIVHRELNNLRSEIDRDLESYKWQIDHVLDSDCQGFDDHFLGKRDKFEFIFIGFKLLSKYDAKTDWIYRLNNKIRLIDQDLSNVLPTLYKHYIQNCDYHYIPELDKPTSLWWRRMHLDLLNNI